MVGIVEEKPTLVADFAAGEGELLLAAERRWGDIDIVALDLDPMMSSALMQRHPSWEVLTGDFTSDSLMTTLPSLHRIRGQVSLILLNPPYSCLGSTKHTVNFYNNIIHCSLALSFIIHASSYLSDSGTLVAILPYACIHSEKDRLARSLLGDKFDVTIESIYERGAFPSCTPRTALVKLSPLDKAAPSTCDWRHKDPARQANIGISSLKNKIRIKIHRGQISVFAAKIIKEGHPLIHTTELRGNTVLTSRYMAPPIGKLIAGPAVLFPRIGKPSPSKVAVLSDERSVVLSDCVIALLCQSNDAAQEIYKSITSNWDFFSDSYGGTCAPYITIKSVTEKLVGLGYSIDNA